MEQISAESIYSKIVLLSDPERDKLYNRMKRDFYQNNEFVICTTDGEVITREQYRQRVNTGIEQCKRNESISLEDLCEELGYSYADL